MQKFLGHHSPAFTLAIYVHLFSDDLPEPVFFDGMVGGGGGEQDALGAAANGASCEGGEDFGGNVAPDTDHGIAEALPF